MKNKLFSRLSALVLMMAMLLPCVMTAPVRAAGEAIEIFKWTAVGNAEKNMAAVSDNLRRSSTRTNTHLVYNLNTTMADGTTKTISSHFMRASATVDYGLPYEYYAETKVKATEGLKVTFNEFTPTTTKGLEAVNVKMTYAMTVVQNDSPIFSVDEFDILVSKDGETWLEEGVGIRSWKLIGQAKLTSTSKTNVYVFEVETENLFDIDGFNPGDKLSNFMIRPHGEYFYSFGWFTLCDTTLNGYETMKDWETAVPAQRSYTYVGEEKMRNIVVNRGYQIANTAWTTDSTIYTEYTTLGIAGVGGEVYPTNYNYRGPSYARTTKGGYELWRDTIVDGKYTGGYSSAPVWGMDCMVFAFDCYSLISRSNSHVIWQTQSDPAMKMLGNIKVDESPTYTNTDIFPLNSKQTIYEGYALLEPGDIVTTYTTGGAIHIRIASATPNVVRNSDGTINGEKSTITFNEQGSALWSFFKAPNGSIVSYKDVDLDVFTAQNPGYQYLYTSVTRPDWEYTFADMYNTYYVPQTFVNYESGMVEDLNYQTILLPKQGDITKGFTATMATNYYICKVNIQLLDKATGQVLFSDEQFYPSDVTSHSAHQKFYGWHYDTPELDAALGQLTNGSYRIAASILAGPVTEVGADRATTSHYYDFTITDKAPAAAVSVKAPTSATKGQTFTVPVNVNAAYAAADVEIKFDADKLTYVSGTVTPDGLIKNVQTNKGLSRITLVDANASAGQLAQLTFTAKEDINGLGSLFTVKSAQLTTTEAANTDLAIKATDASKPCASANFADVAQNAWYHDAVDYALDNSIMGGYNATTFGPNDTLTRAMVVQVLYNKEGQPTITGSHTFPDVKSGDWFNNAVTWANVNKVVGGYGDGRFGPNDNVTLEQIAVILWNYSGNPTPTGDANVLGEHSDWATNALSWAAVKGIFKNVPYVTVTGTATRAQTAQMLMNYLSN